MTYAHVHKSLRSLSSGTVTRQNFAYFSSQVHIVKLLNVQAKEVAETQCISLLLQTG